MTQTEINNLKQLIEVYITDNSDLNDTALATKILADNDTIEVSHRTVRGYVGLLRNELALQSNICDKDFDELPMAPMNEEWLNGNTPSDIEEAPIPEMSATEEVLKEFKVVDNHFQLDHSGKTHSIPVTKVDRIFCAYSKKGLNLSGPTIQSLFGVTADVYRAIVYRLGLTKECAPYSDYTRASLSDEMLYETLAANVKYVLDILYKNDGNATTQLTKVYKEAIVKSQNQELFLSSLFESIKSFLPKVNITPLAGASITSGKSSILHVIIPDMHIGLEQGNYNNKIVKEKLAEILTYIDGHSRVHVSFMGDIIQSVSGLNHQDSWKNMLPDGTGANAIIRPYELLVNFLASIKGLEKVNIVGGNHDRQSSSKNEENTAEGAKLIAYMLRNSLNVPVIFDSNYVKDNDDSNICLLILHGDNPVDKESVQTLSWDYGDPSKFNYVVTAHLHSRKTEPKNDGLRYRKEQIQAFCPADNYGKTVSTGSLPGFKVIYASKDGLPIVLDIPLHYD